MPARRASKRTRCSLDSLDDPLESDLCQPHGISNDTVWQYFAITEKPEHKGLAWCKKCRVWVGRPKGATTNMTRHIADHHKEEVEPAVKQSSTLVQCSIQESIRLMQDTGRRKRARMDIALAQAIISANLTFRTFDNAYFRQFISMLNPNYQLPKHTLATSLVDKYYDVLVSELRSHLMRAESISVTSDAATLTTTGHPYICVTGHFIRDWKIIDVVLALKSAEGRHTAPAISALLDTVMEQWELSHVNTIVTDNGSNFVAAMNIVTKRRSVGFFVDDSMRCACHTLQLLVDDAIDYQPPKDAPQQDVPNSHVQYYIDRVQAIVVFLRQSPLRMQALAEAQRAYRRECRERQATAALEQEMADTLMSLIGLEDDEPKHMDLSYQLVDNVEDHRVITTRANQLILRMATRWSSAFLMLERFALWAPAINATLENRRDWTVPIFDEYELTVIKELVRLLAPFKIATKQLECSSKSPTLSMVWPVLATLNAHLLSLMSNSDPTLILKTAPVIAAAGILHSQLTQRFAITTLTESSQNCLLASLLDPRFKALRWLEPPQQEDIWRLLRSKYDAEVTSSPTTNFSKAPAPPTNLSSLTVKHYMGEDPTRPRERPDNSQFQRYRHTDAIGDSDPLEWWKANEQEFPVIARLAKQTMAIPASSAPSERAFSIANGIATKHRSSLHTTRVAKLVFCKHNMHAIDALNIDLAECWAQSCVDSVDVTVARQLVCALGSAIDRVDTEGIVDE